MQRPCKAPGAPGWVAARALAPAAALLRCPALPCRPRRLAAPTCLPHNSGCSRGNGMDACSVAALQPWAAWPAGSGRGGTRTPRTAGRGRCAARAERAVEGRQCTRGTSCWVERACERMEPPRGAGRPALSRRCPQGAAWPLAEGAGTCDDQPTVRTMRAGARSPIWVNKGGDGCSRSLCRQQRARRRRTPMLGAPFLKAPEPSQRSQLPLGASKQGAGTRSAARERAFWAARAAASGLGRRLGSRGGHRTAAGESPAS